MDDVPLDPHLDQPSGLGSPRRHILGRKITDCRPIKLVAAMSEQRQEPVVQKTGQRHRYAHFFGRCEGESDVLVTQRCSETRRLKIPFR